TFVCEGIDFACPFVLACNLDVNHHLMVHRQIRQVGYGQSFARIALVCPCQNAVSVQLMGANMPTVETPSTAGTGWRRTLSQFYRMIEAIETSPLESLHDRVLRLEQEVSALKRNLPIDSVDNE